MNLEILKRSIWDEIENLEGKTIYTLTDNKKNLIKEVTREYITRVSSNNKVSKISKIFFDNVITELYNSESGMTRTQIYLLNNRNRSSSLLIAILSNVNNFFYYDKELKSIKLI
jgi:hypothetical protein